MLYETLAQPEVLLWVVLSGFLCGFVFDIAGFVNILFDKNKITRFVLDFFASLICGLIFFVVILNTSFGEVRLWQALFFITAILIQRASIGKIVAKGCLLCYNSLIKFLKKFGKSLKK